MSVEKLLTDSVVVFNPIAGVQSRYGDASSAFDTGTTESAFVQPGEAAEIDTPDRDTRRTTLTVFLGADTTATALSEIEWRGSRYQVHGEPRRHFELEGVVHHVELAMEAIAG